ncbi:MAG TPA: c-type cytochrome domain-containing protein [Agriterribacter sp.]|nr:c-type cytochrome domain-containing protein [Agriterribacter sp.]
MEDTPGILIFLGRFHALVVHLPIGFVCLALLVEFFFRKPGHANLQPLIQFTWLLAALSATVSVTLGYLLSLQGGYDDDTLSLHKWAGILLALVIHVCYFLKKYPVKKRLAKYALPVSLGACALLMIITGHYGGSLTHGTDYLSEYKPGSFAEWIGASPGNTGTIRKISSLDSADIFTDAIMPMLKLKCVSCHNAEKKKGGLVLTSFDEMMKGGEDGPAVVAGDLEKSGIYHRITLPEDDKKFMPANGKKPLTDQQVSIVKWWIEKQAPRVGMISALQPDSAMRKTLTSYFGIDENSNSLAVDAPPADPAVIDELVKQGFMVSTLAAKTNLLQVTLNGAGIDEINLDKLVEIKDQLVWLKITHAGKLDDALPIIGQLTNLRKLTLNDNDITDEKMSALLSLSNLEYLNLYRTKLSGQSVETLLQLKNLKQLYVGETNIDSTVMNTLSAQYPNVSIVYKQPDNALPAMDSVQKNKE